MSFDKYSDEELHDVLRYTSTYKETDGLSSSDLLRAVSVFPFAIWNMEKNDNVTEEIYATAFSLCHQCYSNTKINSSIDLKLMFAEIYKLSGEYFFIHEKQTLESRSLLELSKEGIEFQKEVELNEAYFKHYLELNIEPSRSLFKSFSNMYNSQQKILNDLLKITSYHTYVFCNDPSYSKDQSYFNLTDEELSLAFQDIASNILKENTIQRKY